MLEQLPTASRVGKTIVGGIDLNKTRMRGVLEALIALSASPNGFTASKVAERVCALTKQSPSLYGPRHAAYDLKKLRGKHIIRRIGHTRRYEPLLTGLRAMTALLVLRDKAIKPLLAAAQPLRPTRGAHNPKPIDLHYDAIQAAMRGVFHLEVPRRMAAVARTLVSVRSCARTSRDRTGGRGDCDDTAARARLNSTRSHPHVVVAKGRRPCSLIARS